jgi:hypothetical protein
MIADEKPRADRLERHRALAARFARWKVEVTPLLMRVEELKGLGLWHGRGSGRGSLPTPATQFVARRRRDAAATCVKAMFGAFSSARATQFDEAHQDLRLNRSRALKRTCGFEKAFLRTWYSIGFAWLVASSVYLGLRAGPLGILLPTEWIRRALNAFKPKGG